MISYTLTAFAMMRAGSICASAIDSIVASHFKPSGI